ncbi:MAG: hypothetical protein Q4D62_12745 [Planctomycetia bacterium]|nr:hypothetical protein [Planctomycetia bacterium]
MAAETWTIPDGSTETFSSDHQNQDILIESGGTLHFNEVPGQTQAITITNHGNVNFSLSGPSLYLAGSAPLTLKGSGRYTISKTDTFRLYANNVNRTLTVEMDAGGWIDIQDGIFTNGTHGGEVWQNNLGSLNIGTDGTFQLSNMASWSQASAYVDQLTGTGTLGSFDVNTNYMQVGVNNGSSQFDGAITGKASLRKVGTGTLTLTGVNESTGVVDSNGVVRHPSIAVVAGKVVLKEKASAGTGNVSVESAGTLEFAKSENATVSGNLSGTGVILHSGTGTTSFTSAENTFSGTMTIQTGNVTANSLGVAAIQIDSTGTFAYTGSGDSSASIQGTGTLIKEGTGKWTFDSNSTFTGKTELRSGTLNASPAFLAGGVHVTGDAVYELPGQPWSLTLYSGNGQIRPDETGYETTSQGTAWDMTQCANSTSTNRDFISNNSTLSYTTEIYVTEETPITVAGQFDDYAGIFIRTIQDDGSYGAWEAILPFVYHSPTNNAAMQKTYTLQPGRYQLDARVGDNTGSACAYNNFGTAIGLGILEGHQDTSQVNSYQPMTINSVTGILGGIGTIYTVNNVGNVDFPIQIAAEKTLTLQGTPAHSGVVIQGKVTGTGTLKLANTSPETPLEIQWQTSTEGNLHVAEGVRLRGTGEIGGNLTLDDGATLRVSATEDFEVLGDWESIGKSQIVVDITGISENRSWLDVAGNILLSEATKILFVSDSPSVPVVTLTFFEGTDSTEWADWWQNAIDFSQVSSFLNYTDLVADEKGLHVTVGDKNALPEPASVWLILALAGTMLAFRKSLLTKGGG